MVRSVQSGDRDAQLEYALRLFAGQGVAKRRDDAVVYLTQSAAQGQALADVALAVCWATGQGWFGDFFGGGGCCKVSFRVLQVSFDKF